MSAQSLNASLLRVSVLHILRAAGFHSTKPSVLDALVDITERYLLLLASSTATHALANHNSSVPSLTDVRMGLTDCGVFGSTASAAEEEWAERMRRPYEDWSELPHGGRRRERVLQMREDEDTRDVREFVDWVKGDRNREIRRVAGMIGGERSVVIGLGGGGVAGGNMAGPGVNGTNGTGMGEPSHEDWLAALKKKHSKIGEDARYAGTVLGRQGEDKDVKIEGGSVETIQQWSDGLLEKQRTMASKLNGSSNGVHLENDKTMVDAPS